MVFVLKHGIQSLIDESIDIIRSNQPEGEYHLAFSGGIDSQMLIGLADDAKSRYVAVYQNDLAPPQVKQFIRTDYPQVIWEKQPNFNFYEAIVKIGFPLRQARWCCEFMKERGGNGQTVLVGVRKQESKKRSKYQTVEQWDKKDVHKLVVRPLLHWTRQQEKTYLLQKGIKWCNLYEHGFERLGCVLCPMHSVKQKRFEVIMFPKIALAWQHAFDRLYNDRTSKGNDSVKRWSSGTDMFNWYINEPKKIPNEQLKMILNY